MPCIYLVVAVASPPNGCVRVCFWCQLGPKKVVPLSLIEEKWKDIALPKEQYDELVRIGNFSGDVEWLKFFALGCSALGEVGRSVVVVVAPLHRSM